MHSVDYLISKLVADGKYTLLITKVGDKFMGKYFNKITRNTEITVYGDSARDCYQKILDEKLS